MGIVLRTDQPAFSGAKRPHLGLVVAALLVVACRVSAAEVPALEALLQIGAPDPALVLRYRSDLERIVDGDDHWQAAEAAGLLARVLIDSGDLEAAHLIIERAGKGVEESGNAWALLGLFRSEVASRRGNQRDAALLAEQIASSPVVPALRYRAAVLAGRLARDAKREDDARRLWRWASQFAKRTWYAGAPAGFDALEADRCLAQMERSTAAVQDEADRLFAQAERERSAGRWEQAEGLYGRFADNFVEDPRRPLAQWAVGICLRGLGKYQEAIDHWAEFIKSDPSGRARGTAMVSIVETELADLGNIADARIWAERGLVVVKSQRPEEGSEWWEVARSLYVRLALLDWIDEAYEKAEGSLLAAKRFPTALDNGIALAPGSAPVPGGTDRLLALVRTRAPLVPLSARDQRHPRAILSLAVAELAAVEWRFADAIPAFLAVAGQSDLAAPSQRAHALLQAGMCYHAEGKAGQQIGCYTRILTEYPSTPAAPEARLCLGVAQLSALEKPELALDTWAELIKRYPASEEAKSALLYIGLVHYRAGRVEDAESAWRALERSDPRHPWRKVIRERYREPLDRLNQDPRETVDRDR